MWPAETGSLTTHRSWLWRLHYPLSCQNRAHAQSCRHSQTLKAVSSTCTTPERSVWVVACNKCERQNWNSTLAARCVKVAPVKLEVRCLCLFTARAPPFHPHARFRHQKETFKWHKKTERCSKCSLLSDVSTWCLWVWCLFTWCFWG